MTMEEAEVGRPPCDYLPRVRRGIGSVTGLALVQLAEEAGVPQDVVREGSTMTSAGTAPERAVVDPAVDDVDDDKDENLDRVLRNRDGRSILRVGRMDVRAQKEERHDAKEVEEVEVDHGEDSVQGSLDDDILGTEDV